MVMLTSLKYHGETNHKRPASCQASNPHVLPRLRGSCEGGDHLKYTTLKQTIYQLLDAPLTHFLLRLAPDK